MRCSDLSSESIKQGHGDLVDSIIESCVDFVYSEDIGKWIELQGGWQRLRHITRVERSTSNSNYAVDHHRLAKVYNMVFATVAICFIVSSLFLFLVSLIR